MLLYNDGIILTEADADEFLEFVGVELFENHIMINGQHYSGSNGEAILESNGIFLYEDHILVEGQQADEYYKARRERAKEEDQKWEDQYQKRYGNTKTITTLVPKDRIYHGRGDDTYQNKNYTSGGVSHDRVKKTNLSPRDKIAHWNKNSREFNKAHLDVAKEKTRRDIENDWANPDQKVDGINTMYKHATAADALARHRRRHPDQYKEAADIFSSINFI